MIYRQGDVLIIKSDDVPEQAQLIAPDARQRYVLADGEATGHAHAITVQDGVKVSSLAESLFIQADVPVEITHEEHAPVMLPAGVWRVVRQVEYAPQRLRRVLD